MGLTKMPSLIRRAAVGCAVSLFVMGAQPGSAAVNGLPPNSIADLADQLLGSVVNISTSGSVTTSRSAQTPETPGGDQLQPFFDDLFNRQQRGAPAPRRVQSQGSGFIVDSSGIVVTNHHVIENGDEITVILNDGTRMAASVVGIDKETDIAVLKVKPAKPLPAVKFGDSDKLRVGDWLVAVGNPFGLGESLTVGVLSARNRDINSGPYDDFLQTDAAINRGNSGGPLFNMDGEVIGIDTAIISPSGGSIGIGFAIPSSVAVNVIDQLRQNGKMSRGWLGVKIQEVTEEIADGLKLARAQGALVQGVTEGSPAALAGLKSGDVVIGFAGKPIAQMRQLPRTVAGSPVGPELDIKFIRNGEERTLKVTLAPLGDRSEQVATATPRPAPPVNRPASLGLTLSDLSAALRSQYNVQQGISGVVVTGVTPGSPAQEKGIQTGEVIVEVDQTAVSSPADVDKKVQDLRSQNRRTALFLVANKSGELRFVAVRLE